MDAPRSEGDLVDRAIRLTGRRLGSLADGLEHTSQLRAKGQVGALLEALLGATAGNRPVPDFEALGIELKSVPVDDRGRPRESTYVCTAPLSVAQLEPSWQTSRVRKKLARVLWVPIVGKGPVKDRVVGRPVLWSPSEEQEAVLARDWRVLTDIVIAGEIWNINARHGKALQLRPKAANSETMTWMVDDEGEWARTNPQGFYLRARFTREIVG